MHTIAAGIVGIAELDAKFEACYTRLTLHTTSVNDDKIYFKGAAYLDENSTFREVLCFNSVDQAVDCFDPSSKAKIYGSFGMCTDP